MINWPEHKVSLCLTHNGHKSYYRSVAEAIEDKDHGYRENDWINSRQMQKAIETNDCWTLHWYPHTPIGSYVLSAHDLDELLKVAREMNE